MPQIKKDLKETRVMCEGSWILIPTNQLSTDNFETMEKTWTRAYMSS